ncbi:MAG: benzoate/toluate 1,2-dioxygenase alpha subunit [Candidatus Kentron sp. G]|nr:MAG: benzoate/toluate 1,2-dioxygenase alpha subunit [Candidatus Kentron sp. G]VFN02087.1 MAG: benzoate/toluate 1,2-dioxygenase alpha subunit [Candidatus Kentron sp. G]VFN03571.1 MAG: benzoate/toluate 1,2-dioxygenase alpha subunit [Candidatus Kentron sp. G]
MNDPEHTLDTLIEDNADSGTFRVHVKAFTDPAIFEKEKQRVFRKTWFYAAHESELPTPESFVSRKVAGQSLIISRDANGELHALINACRHRGALVCREDAGSSKLFTCPYHGWSFDTRGALVGIPGKDAYEGTGFDRKAFGLVRMPRIERYRGFIFVHSSADAEPLSDFLAEARTFLDLIADQAPEGLEVLPGSHRYAIRANWKLVSENGIDSYHFRTLHRRYLGFMRSKGAQSLSSDDAFPPKGCALGNGHGADEHQNLAAMGRFAGCWGPLFPAFLKPDIETNHARLERLHGARRAYRISHVNRSLRLFPNLYILDHCNTTIRCFFPTAVDEVEVTEWVLGAKGESETLRRERLRTHSGLPGPASFVSPDDIDTLESCQRGLVPQLEWLDYSRGMKRAEPLHTDELQLRSFYRHWHSLMTNDRVSYPQNAR